MTDGSDYASETLHGSRSKQHYKRVPLLTGCGTRHDTAPPCQAVGRLGVSARYGCQLGRLSSLLLFVVVPILGLSGCSESGGSSNPGRVDSEAECREPSNPWAEEGGGHDA